MIGIHGDGPKPGDPMSAGRETIQGTTNLKSILMLMSYSASANANDNRSKVTSPKGRSVPSLVDLN